MRFPRPAALLLAALLPLAPRTACGQAQQVADRERAVAQQMAICPVKAKQARLDAGLVSPHAEVKFEAILLNTLDRPVKCIRSAPSCTCTTVDMLGKVIPAGGTLSVPLSMRTSGATGEKTAEVVLMFEDTPGAVQLSIRAEVSYPVRGLQENRMPDGSVRRDPFVNAYDIKENIRGTVTVESVDGKPFRVLSVGGEAPAFADGPSDGQPRNAWKVRYDWSSLPCERIPKYLVIETDRPDARLVDMRVRHECTRINPAFAFAQYRENLGVIAPGETKPFELEIKHANGVRIDSVTSTDPRLDAKLLEQKPGADDGALVRVAVTAKDGAADGVVLTALRFAGVGPDPKTPVPPGQPAATAPRETEFLVYGKIERPMKLQAKPLGGGAPREVPPAVRDQVLAPPAPALDPRIDGRKITSLRSPEIPGRVIQPLPVVMRIAEHADQVPMDPARFAAARAAIDRGLAFLRGTQGPNGGWMEGTAAAGTDQSKGSKAVSAAVTALVLKAFAQAGHPARSDAAAAKALAFIVDRTHPGKAFEPDLGGGLANYVASMVLMGLASQQDTALAAETESVRRWLVANQWDQAEGIGPGADWFGGAGYGNHGRPDLSNTQLMLDALHDAGVSPDDPAVQRALVFVSRAQNVRTNDAAWAQHGTFDGGFVYTGANGGESFASDAAGEGRYGEKMPADTRSLRSYGSMTYAGFKSMLYAGLAPDDPRVVAAYGWIRAHYGFRENPGLGLQGLYYYLHAAARALLASGAVTVEATGTAGTGTATGTRNWRNDLVDAVIGAQRPDGSWANSADRWQEGQPDLVGAYAILALEEAIKPVRNSD